MTSNSWTEKQAASIDWANADEVAAHNFTMNQLLSFHTPLREKMMHNPAEYARCVQVLGGGIESEKVEVIKQLIAENCFTLRSERFCQNCRAVGHTLTHCPHDLEHHTATAQHQRHLLHLERLKLKEDRKPKKRALKLKQVPLTTIVGSGVTGDSSILGQIQSIDEEAGRGTIGSNNVSYTFFLDRCDYGLKKVRLGDKVNFKIETYNGRVTAIDITPQQPALTQDDIQTFLDACNQCIEPVRQMRGVLMQRQSWGQFLRAVQPQQLGEAVNIIIRLTTFITNRSPIHNRILGAFLSLLISSSGSTNFFPNLVLTVVPKLETLEGQLESNVNLVDNLLEIADFALLCRTHTKITLDVCEKLLQPLQVAVEFCVANTQDHSTRWKKLQTALQFIVHCRVDHVSIPVIPSAEEISCPPSFSRSVFNPKNLPVNASTVYKSGSEFADAQCALLRADVFFNTARMIPAGCLTIPDLTIDQDMQDDLNHTKMYNHVKFIGRTVPFDWDQADSYIFQVKSTRENPRWEFALNRGTFVCFVTTLDQSVLPNTELFWGVVSATDEQLRHSGVGIIHPCGSSDFSLLIKNLKRNEEAGAMERSVLMETNVFIQGYEPVMKAMGHFVGPKAMSVPHEDILVFQQKRNSLVSYIPQHCRGAFDRIVTKIRGSLSLDPGQDLAMKQLATSPVLLIQGPPGTGKSFIGCRIVESIVRFKQTLMSGSIFDSVAVEALPNCNLSTIAPDLGPIVVITYKNHALDEFLLDLKNSGLWVDGNNDFPLKSEKTVTFAQGCRMIRVGSGSQEASLEPYQVGHMMTSRAHRHAIGSGRSKVNILLKKLERLAREVQQLERGSCPPHVMNRWFTDDQKKSFSPIEDLKPWLNGEKYTGDGSKQVNETCSAQLKSKMALLLFAAQSTDTALPRRREREEDSDDEGELTVFGAMKKEFDKSARQGDNLETYKLLAISAEAIGLIAQEAQKPSEVPDDMLSLWALRPQTRHDYLAYLFKREIAGRTKEYISTLNLLKSAVNLLNHAIDESRLELLRSADVIGLTTTGCAMHQELLRTLEPSVLVVEEAAEVLESQLLACLTDSLKQIVLIGDHFQLQPKVETMALEKNNNLNISLFERLVEKIDPILLIEQRRMKPEISKLIRPFYKQKMEDHFSVSSRLFVDSHGYKHVGSVPGLERDVFLWTHSNPEELAPVGRSKINRREIDMVLLLARHLLEEGVKPSSIAVITPYLGQRRAIAYAMRSKGKLMADIRVSTVDRFQGDEADIVLLSLVRTERLTEFLRMRNRMIVSCSRARFAMIIMGNASLLERSLHWNQLLRLLHQDGAIGDNLPLNCEGRRFTIDSTFPAQGWPEKMRPRQQVSNLS